MKIPNVYSYHAGDPVSLARIVSEDSQQEDAVKFLQDKSSKDS